MTDSNPLRAALWMGGAIVSFSAMAVAGRELASELGPPEVMLYRSLLGIVLVAGLLVRSGEGFGQVRTASPGLHAWRNLFHFAGQNFWFYGIASIPLSQLVALEFTNPIWVALLAPLVLGEAMTRTRALAAGLGFLGVLIVAQPGVAPLGWGHAAGLGAAAGFAANTLLTRRIMSRDSVLCVLFWMVLSQAAMGFLAALPGGIAVPSAHLLPWVAVVSVCGLTAHFSLTSALGHAPAAVVAPMEFLRLPVVTLLGALVYAEPVMWPVLAGAVVILSGNLMSLMRERRSATP